MNLAGGDYLDGAGAQGENATAFMLVAAARGSLGAVARKMGSCNLRWVQDGRWPLTFCLSGFEQKTGNLRKEGLTARGWSGTRNDSQHCNGIPTATKHSAPRLSSHYFLVFRLPQQKTVSPGHPTGCLCWSCRCVGPPVSVSSLGAAHADVKSDDFPHCKNHRVEAQALARQWNVGH